MNPTVTPPAEKQRRRLHPPLASRGWAGRSRSHRWQCFLRIRPREARAAVLFLRIGPECPAHGQSELTWASKPDWDSYHTKHSNIRHHQDRAQNKGWNRNSRLQTIPRQGQAARAIRAGRGQLQPRRDFTYQTASRLLR